MCCHVGILLILYCAIEWLKWWVGGIHFSRGKTKIALGGMDGFDATTLSNFQLVQCVLAIFSELLRRGSLQDNPDGGATSSSWVPVDSERGLRSPERC